VNVLLDTSVVIDYEKIVLAAHSESVAFVSTVTIGELAYGLGSTDDPVKRMERSERYHTALETFGVLEFDLAAARQYGMLAALVRESGRNPRPRRFDLQIAATAAAHGLPLLTRNPDDFKGTERLVDVISV
jgi:predicted nucleic acid-binding protein